MKIKVFYRDEPVIEIKKQMSGGEMVDFGLHRDRQPDSGWSELRWTRMDSNGITEVELTDELRKKLIEDICYSVPSTHVYNKLKEFDLIK